MNPGRKFVFVAICTAIGFIAYQSQRTGRPELDSAVVERTLNGFVEYHARALRLATMKDSPLSVEWSAVVCADPSKPELLVNFRNVSTPRETWEAATLKPIAFIVDGKSLALSPYQALRTDDGESVAMVNVKGARSTLKKVVAAKSLEIEFGGRRHEIGEQGMTTLRELWKRSSPSNGPKA